MMHTFEYLRFEDGAKGQFTCTIEEAENRLEVAKQNTVDLEAAIKKAKVQEKAQELIDNNQI